MLGFIHPSERYAEPRLGQVLDARVIGFREVDRTLNLSLKPRSLGGLMKAGKIKQDQFGTELI